MEHLRGLKEITEIEFLIYDHRGDIWPSWLDLAKPLAINILQESECHKDCICEYECGCAETNECGRCNPPRRFLRVKSYPNTSLDEATGRLLMHSSICLEEIEVAPLRILSPK